MKLFTCSVSPLAFQIGLVHYQAPPADLTEWPRGLKILAETFWGSRGDPAVLFNVLEMNRWGRYHGPDWLRCVFIELVVVFHSDWWLPTSLLYDDKPAIERLVAATEFTSADLPRISSWALFGHPGSHTLCHQDACGVLTHVNVCSGRKLWYLLEWVKTPQPKDWLARCRNMETCEFFALEYDERPPWILGTGRQARISASSYEQHHANWESKRIARWRVVELTPGTTL